MSNQDLQEQAQPVERGEQALWCAVIDRAMDDACGHCGGISRNKESITDTAAVWLKDAGRDMHFVCDLADLNAQSVRNRAVGKIERASLETPARKRHKNVRYDRSKRGRQVPLEKAT